MQNKKLIFQIITFVTLALLGMTWDSVFSFINPNELRIDQSGLLSVIYIFSNGLMGEKFHLGSDFMFPYGPMLYWKYNLYWPGLYWYGLLCKYFFILAFSILLNELFGRNKNLKPRNILIILLATIWTIWLGTDAIYYCFAILLGFLYLDNNIRVSKSLSFILITQLSILILSKFTFLIISVFLISLYLIQIFRKKGSFFIVANYLIILIIFWCILCNQSLLDIPNYIKSSMELTSHFGNGMSIGWLDNRIILIQVIVGIFSSLVLLWSVWYFINNDRNYYSGKLLLTYIAFCTFLVFKHGFTRHDGHAAHFSSTVIFMAIFLIAYYSNYEINFSYKKILKYLLLISIGSNYLIVNYWYPTTSNRGFIGVDVRAVFDKTLGLATAPMRMFEYNGKLDKLFQDRVKEFRSKVGEVPPGVTIDSWPDNSALAIFSAGVYTPRPMPFAFSAYSPYLTRANANFINSPKAPEFYIFEVNTIDGHLPTNDDPLSWMALFQNYSIYSILGERLLLKRREISRGIIDKGEATLIAKFDELIELPKTSNLLLIDIKLKKNIFGKIVNLIYKLPDIKLTTYSHNGVESNFKFIPGISKFIISPQIIDISDSVGVFSNPGADNKLTYIGGVKVTSAFKNLFYENKFDLTYEEKLFEKSNQAEDFLERFKSRNTLLNILRTQKISQPGVELSSIPTKEGGRLDAIFAHAPSNIVIPANNYQYLLIKYGMRPESYGGLDGDGVSFTVISEDIHKHKTELFSRTLNPANVKNDQGIFFKKIVIPDNAKYIYLKTSPGQNGNTSYDQAYWADIKLQ